MKELTKLANKYKSDKGSECGSKHNFTDIYDDYFQLLKNKNINILEVGINNGSSLKIWYEYFLKASIMGLDIDNKSYYDNDRISCGILDQSSEEQLQYFSDNINNTFDIILDDGSHHISDQQKTFFYLFKLLNPGGIYIIEDLHTSLCDPGVVLYGRLVENNIEQTNTTLYYLKNKPHSSTYLDKNQNKYLQNNIKEVIIFEKDNNDVPDDYKNKSITSIIIKK